MEMPLVEETKTEDAAGVAGGVVYAAVDSEDPLD